MQESFLAAKRALICRSTAGREAVSKAKSQLEIKNRVLDEACDILRDISIGHERAGNYGCTPHLFEVLSDESRSCNVPPVDLRTQLTFQRDRCCRPIDLGVPWQRIVDQKWIIGVQAVNISNESVFDLHLVLTTSRRSLVHATNSFKLGNNFTRSPSGTSTCSNNYQRLPKRQRLDRDFGKDVRFSQECLQVSEAVHLTTTIDIGILEQDPELPVNVFVTYRWQVDGKLVPGCMNCRAIVLRMKDLLDDRLRINLTKKHAQTELLCDLAAIEATTEEFHLTFLSKQTDLTDLARFLEMKAQFTSIVEQPEILVWTSIKIEVLKGVLLKIARLEAKDKALIDINARNRNQLFVCIEYLYTCLPEDIIIVPSEEEIRPSLASTITTELNLIINFVDSNFKTMDHLRYSPLEGEMDGSTSKFKLRMDDEADIDNYRKFRDALLRLETKTDNHLGVRQCSLQSLQQTP